MSVLPGLDLTCSALPSPCSTCSSFRLDQTPSGGEPRYNMSPLVITSMFPQQPLTIQEFWTGQYNKKRNCSVSVGRSRTLCVCSWWAVACSSFSLPTASSSRCREASCSRSEGTLCALVRASSSATLSLSCSAAWVFSTTLCLTLASLCSFCCGGERERIRG